MGISINFDLHTDHELDICEPNTIHTQSSPLKLNVFSNSLLAGESVLKCIIAITHMLKTMMNITVQ